MVWSTLNTSHHSHHGLGGYSKLIIGLRAAASGARCMLTSELTAHLLKCIVRGCVCCPLIHDSLFIDLWKVRLCPRPDVFRKMLLIARNALFTSEPTLDLAISLATTFFSCKDRAIRNLKFGDKTTIMFLLKVFIDKNIHIDDYTVSNKNVIRVSNSPSSKLRLPSFSVRRLTVNCVISELARSTWPQTHRPRGIKRPSN